jgi:hypothetical protein
LISLSTEHLKIIGLPTEQKESRVVFDAAYKAQRWALYTKLSIEHNREAPKVAIL